MYLADLSIKVVYYGNILDVLMQHHPEYVALAWGSFKLAFVVSGCAFGSIRPFCVLES